MSIPLIAGLGPQELIIIAVVLVLLFGAKKLPELARGSGQAGHDGEIEPHWSMIVPRRSRTMRSR